MEADAPSGSQPNREKESWLRALAVFQSPRTAFGALRNDSDEHADARQEPVLLIAWLAGIAGVLAFGSTTATLLDPAAGEFFRPVRPDALDAALLVFLAGGLYGIGSYWIGGGALYVGIRGAGGQSSYRQARHLFAFAAAPLVLVALVVWPLRLAVFGGDNFRTGGADTGAGVTAFELVESLVFLWAVALLVVGLRTVYEWSVTRALIAVVLAVLVLVLFTLPLVLA